jgi:hypothetical protein
MQARSNLEAEALDAVADREGTPYTAGRAVERGQEAVPCRRHLAAPKARYFVSAGAIMALQELAPGAVTERRRPLRRVHDVREEHRRQHAVVVRGQSGSPAGEELADGPQRASTSPA